MLAAMLTIGTMVERIWRKLYWVACCTACPHSWAATASSSYRTSVINIEAQVYRMVGRVIVVSKLAFHLSDFYIVNLVVPQHGRSDFGAAHAILEGYLGVFFKLAF